MTVTPGGGVNTKRGDCFNSASSSLIEYHRCIKSKKCVYRGWDENVSNGTKRRETDMRIIVIISIAIHAI